jgi:hypothetical protein
MELVSEFRRDGGCVPHPTAPDFGFDTFDSGINPGNGLSYLTRAPNLHRSACPGQCQSGGCPFT